MWRNHNPSPIYHDTVQVPFTMTLPNPSFFHDTVQQPFTMTLFKPSYHGSYNLLPWPCSNPFAMFTIGPTTFYHGTVQTLLLYLPWVLQPFTMALFKPFCYIYHESNKCYNDTGQTILLCLPWVQQMFTMTRVKPFYYVYHESNKCLP